MKTNYVASLNDTKGIKIDNKSIAKFMQMLEKCYVFVFYSNMHTLLVSIPIQHQQSNKGDQILVFIKARCVDFLIHTECIYVSQVLLL